jgi:hypothetical protein
MKQKEINKVLDAFVNKEITMKEAETKLLNLFGVGSSYLIITKENYSDGVKSIYEEVIKASDLEHAKEEAYYLVKERNEYLGRDGRCHLVGVREA